MKITVVGTGYVGLVTGACFAEMGNKVVCVDSDQNKIENLKKGIIPIYEPGLEELVKHSYEDGRLYFLTSLQEEVAPADIYFIAVGTPSGEDGSSDLRYVLEAAKQLGQYIADYSIIVNKSTVPVGTADKVRNIIQTELDKRKVAIRFDVVSNPEFLKEGSAVDDFMRPERVIIGTNSVRAKKIMEKIYAPFTINHACTIYMSNKDAEMTKYASNAMLATKISFMNEVANICEKTGVDVTKVRIGMGYDSRIGFSFTYAGCGYGGSCFPKDVKALIHLAKENDFDPCVLSAVEKRNCLQKQVLSTKLIRKLGKDLSDINIAVWGLAFKPNTDDMREAPSIEFLSEVISLGASVKAYDPVANNQAKKILPQPWFVSGNLKLVNHQEAALVDADVLVLLTEWRQFREPNFNKIKQLMKGTLIIDGRNQYDPVELRKHGFIYVGVGRK